MKLLKTDFGKVHLVVMLFALVNVTMALAMKLKLLPYEVAIEAHELSGFLLLPLLALLPALFKKRKNVYAALKARLFISKRDLAHRNVALLLAKGVTMLMLLGYVLQLLTAGLMKTGLGYQWFPTLDLYTFHTNFIFVLPVLMALHVVFMLLSQRRPKPAAKA